MSEFKYTDDGTILLQAPQDVETYYAPAGVVAVGQGAFRGCDRLREVVLSEGVERIEEDAFRGCAALRSIVFPDTLLTIQEWAFESCAALETLVLPENLQIVGTAAFAKCVNLREIKFNSNLKEIDVSAFYLCKSLESVVLPDGLNYIGEGAFHECAPNFSASLNSKVETQFVESFRGVPLPNYVVREDSEAIESADETEELSLFDGDFTLDDSDEDSDSFGIYLNPESFKEEPIEYKLDDKPQYFDDDSFDSDDEYEERAYDDPFGSDDEYEQRAYDAIEESERRDQERSDAPSDLSAVSPLTNEEPAPQNSAPQNSAAPNGVRVERWKQKLLDLTNRNRLLNMREDKKTVEFFLFPYELGPLEDSLYEGDAYSIAPLTPELDDKSRRQYSGKRYRDLGFVREFAPIFSSSLKKKTLYARPGLEQDELNKRLDKIAKQAQKDLQEGGVNTLYLSLGTISRPDRNEPDKIYDAPALLVPVKLTGSINKGGFTLVRCDEDEILNVTLLELMRRDYGKEVRSLDPNNLPTDQSGLDVELIFNTLEKEVSDLEGWSLRREITLSLFSFQKYIMWSDLNDRFDELKKNPIVRHLAFTPKERYKDGAPQIDARALDSDYPYSKTVIPLSADSSQLAAVLTAEGGKSFVLQGPPGTGKSQTIANIIAHCLYCGKKILFVAEKRAALDVVYSRLNKLGLGTFCLELHSNKAGRGQVLEQLEQALKYNEEFKSDEWENSTLELEKLRTSLNAYVKELHRVYPNGLSFYDALSYLAPRAELGKKAPRFTTEESFREISQDRFNALKALGRDLRQAALNLPQKAWDELKNFSRFDWTPQRSVQIRDAANALDEQVDEYRSKIDELANVLGIEPAENVEEHKELVAFGQNIVDSQFKFPKGFYSRSWKETEKKVQDYLRLEKELADATQNLNASGLDRYLAARAKASSVTDAIPAIRAAGYFSEQTTKLDSDARTLAPKCAEFAQSCGSFFKATKALLDLLKLHKNTFSEFLFAAINPIVDQMRAATAPNETMLLDDWRNFASDMRKLTEASAALEELQTELGGFKLDDAGKVEFVELDDDAHVDSIFANAFQASQNSALVPVPNVESETAQAYRQFTDAARQVEQAARNAFDAINVTDVLTEEIVSKYVPIFRALSFAPPRSEKFLDSDWERASKKLRELVVLTRDRNNARKDLDGYDYEALMKTRLPKTRENRTIVSTGSFALGELRNYSTNASFSGFSLAEHASNNATYATNALDSFVKRADALVDASSKLLDKLGLSHSVDENSASALRALVTAMRARRTTPQNLPNEDWAAFSVQARNVLALGRRNAQTREPLVEFNLVKVSGYDAAAGRAKLTKLNSAVFLAGFRRNLFVKSLKKLTTSGESALCSYDRLEELFGLFDEYQNSERELQSWLNFSREKFDALLEGDRPNWEAVENYLDVGDAAEAIFKRCELARDLRAERFEEIKRFWTTLESENSPESALCRAFDDAWNEFDREADVVFPLLAGYRDVYERGQAEFAANPNLCAERFGDDWQSENSNFQYLIEALDKGDALVAALKNALGTRSNVAPFLQNLGVVWTRENYDGKVGKAALTFVDAWKNYELTARKAAKPLASMRAAYVANDEIVKRCSPKCENVFSASSPFKTKWVSTLDAGDKIVESVGKIFSQEESKQALLGVVNAFWFKLNDENSNESKALAKYVEKRTRIDEQFPAFVECVDAEPLTPSAPTSDVDSTKTIDLDDFAAAMANYLAAKSKFTSASEKIRDYLDAPGFAPQTALQAAQNLDFNLRAVPSLVEADPQKLDAARDALGTRLDFDNSENSLAQIDKFAKESDGAQNELLERYRQLIDATAFNTSMSEWHEDEFLTRIKEFGALTLRNVDVFPLWANWLDAQSKAAVEFPEFAKAFDERSIELDSVAESIQYRLYERFADELVADVPAFKELVGDVRARNRSVSRFALYDQKYAQAAKEIAVKSLAAGLPKERFAEKIKYKRQSEIEKEIGELRRLIGLKKLRRSLRDILASIKTVLRELKPCLLMSPLSVAQYIPADSEKFDLVIFDEASQIPTWDAIGSIARGNQLIVVGDSKQLPPTSFFLRGAADDEIVSEDDVEESESVLDECCASQLPEIMLKWHYRSRREALIAFSNERYYNGKLNTFPSSARYASGVRLEYVPKGVYDRGGSRANEIEAERLVDLVVERLRDPDFKGKSLGIVTFNEAQRDLIEDKLEQKRADYPEIDPYFSLDYFEPTFVKNLENVQGDERDVIFFSVCYGKDADGHMTQNYGPLNRVGGERRLNVAVTRAKEEIVVVSSINGADVEPSKTAKEQALGVPHFKEFLLYAERGGVAQTHDSQTNAQEEFPLEADVANWLRGRGFDVVEQVGCAKDKVDLALVDPDSPNEYAVAIECDGQDYRDATTARDRDLLRKNVLEGLGWQVVRVWSTTWQYNRTHAQDKLIADIQAALEKRKQAKRNAKTSGAK